MEGSKTMDVQTLGVQLQSLLNIPSIGSIKTVVERPEMTQQNKSKDETTSHSQQSIVKTEDNTCDIAADVRKKRVSPKNFELDSSKKNIKSKRKNNYKAVQGKATSQSFYNRGHFSQPHYESVYNGPKDDTDDISKYPFGVYFLKTVSKIPLAATELIQRKEQLKVTEIHLHRHRPPIGIDAIPSEIRRMFYRQFINTLSSKSMKFPRARFFCTACNYHMDTIASTIDHCLQDRHVDITKMRRLDCSFRTLKDYSPTLAHYEGLTSSLLNWFDMEALASNSELMSIRQDIVKSLQMSINRKFVDLIDGPRILVTLFGSSVTGWNSGRANLNINVSFENAKIEDLDGLKSSTDKDDFDFLLRRTILGLKYDRRICTPNVKRNSSGVKFVIDYFGLNGQAHFLNSGGIFLTKLFLEYGKLDDRVGVIAACFRMWAAIAEIDNQETGGLPGHSYIVLALHYLQRCGVIPVLQLMPKSQNELFATAEEAKRTWKTENKDSVGYIWLNMFKYFSKFDFENYAVSITCASGKISRKDKQWNRKLSIEDPIFLKSNISRCVSSSRCFDFILDTLKASYVYFSTPQNFNGLSLFDGVVDDRSQDSVQHVLRNVKNPNIEVTSLTGYKNTSDFVKYGIVNVELTPTIRRRMILKSDFVKIRPLLENFNYAFDPTHTNFTLGCKFPLICKACGVEGHVRVECPEETLPTARPVPDPMPETINLLSDCIYLNYQNETLNNNDMAKRQQVLEDTRNALYPVYGDLEANIDIFGSTCNGFGTHQSDIDMCLTFKNLKVRPTASSTEKSPLIQNLKVGPTLDLAVRALRSAGCFTDVVAISSAKVPIVKFSHRPTGLDGDISLYNQLASYNTDLLYTYCQIDKRLPILGCFLKKIAKLCDIGDASKGTLSSYAYMLMLIHYLQHTDPPVLPRLQDLNASGDNGVEIMIDGHKVSYFKNLNLLPRVWEDYGQNRMSLGALWLGFIRYYTETFNFDDRVVTITREVPDRDERPWNTDSIAIKDPFDGKHNLGSGLTRRMTVHILKNFMKIRDVFHNVFPSFKTAAECLSCLHNANILSVGNPPIDRQCRICMKIGHYARNCPQGKGSEVNNIVENVFGKDTSKSSSKKDSLADVDLEALKSMREFLFAIDDQVYLDHRDGVKSSKKVTGQDSQNSVENGPTSETPDAEFTFFGGNTPSAEDQKIKDIVHNSCLGVTFDFDHLSELKKREELKEQLHLKDIGNKFIPEPSSSLPGQNILSTTPNEFPQMPALGRPPGPEGLPMPNPMMPCPVPALSCPVYTINGVQYANVPQNMWYGGYNHPPMPVALVPIRPMEVNIGTSAGPSMPPPGFTPFHPCNVSPSPINSNMVVNSQISIDSRDEGGNVGTGTSFVPPLMPVETDLSRRLARNNPMEQPSHENMDRHNRYGFTPPVGNVTPDILKSSDATLVGNKEDVSCIGDPTGRNHSASGFVMNVGKNNGPQFGMGTVMTHENNVFDNRMSMNSSLSPYLGTNAGGSPFLQGNDVAFGKDENFPPGFSPSVANKGWEVGQSVRMESGPGQNAIGYDRSHGS